MALQGCNSTGSEAFRNSLCRSYEKESAWIIVNPFLSCFHDASRAMSGKAVPLTVPRKLKALNGGCNVTGSDKAGGLEQAHVLTAVSNQTGYLAVR